MDPLTARRWFRSACVIATGVLLFIAVVEFVVLAPFVLSQGAALGVDFHQVEAGARSWLAGDGFYLARQLNGPYTLGPGDILYPPTLLYLLLPFLWLPEFLWWLIPLGIVTVVVLRLRPAPWAWALIALALVWPQDQALVFFGNPTMWVAAAVAGGVIWGWPSAFVLLKPSLAPLALIGIRTRGWWITVAVMAVLTLPLLPLCQQYLQVLRDSSGTVGYSLAHLPFVLIPVVARLGSTSMPPVRLGWRRAPAPTSGPVVSRPQTSVELQ